MPVTRWVLLSLFLLVPTVSAVLVAGPGCASVVADQESDEDGPVPLITSPDPDMRYIDTDNVLFDGSSSWDPDGDPISYLWYSDLEGYLGSEPTFQRSLRHGQHRITLQLSDGTVNSATSVVITVEVDPLTVDTDRDGLPDVTDADDDNDGLSDEEEDLNGNGLIDMDETDPKGPDTDGDGINDLKDEYPLDPYHPPPRSKDRSWTEIPLFAAMGAFDILFVLGLTITITVLIVIFFRNRKKEIR